MRDEDGLNLYAEALGVFLRQHPGRAGPVFAGAGGVLDQPRRIGENADAQRAGLFDGVDARALTGRRRFLRESRQGNGQQASGEQQFHCVFHDIPPDG